MPRYDPEVYKANREAQLAASRKYYQKNRERLIAKQKAYDELHREEIRARKNKPKVSIE
jgi:hypothetical protein